MTEATHHHEIPAPLVRITDQARAEAVRADTKAQTLLGVVGVLIAALVALGTRPLPVPAYVALGVAGLVLVAAELLLLSAIRPRLVGEGSPGTWLHAATAGPSSIIDAITTASESDFDTWLRGEAFAASVLANIPLVKFHRIRKAVDLLIIGLAVIAVGFTLVIAL